MEQLPHKKILIISLCGALITGAGLIACIILRADWLTVVPAVLMILPLSSLSTIYAIKFQDKFWPGTIAKYALFLFPVILVTAGYIEFTGGNYWVIVMLIVLLVLISILALVHIFVYASATSLSGVIIILISLVAGIFLKRNHLMFAGVTISVFSMCMSIGSFMFGIRCLFLSENITYFKNVTFFGSCAISIAFIGQMFKLQHWPAGGIFVLIGLTSLIIGTLYLLLTLHSSGYIDWKPFHKKILRRILIPWTFIFILYISRFMVPELDTLIWSPDSFITDKTVPSYGFGMKDYTIDNKDLIKPE